MNRPKRALHMTKCSITVFIEHRHGCQLTLAPSLWELQSLLRWTQFNGAQDKALLDAFALVMLILNLTSHAVTSSTFGTDDLGTACFAEYRFICWEVIMAFPTSQLQN